MAELPRIRTPWKQQWRRIRYQLVPVVCMCAAVLTTGWLWSRRTVGYNLIGEAHVKTRDVLSPISGVLVPLKQKPQIGLLDRVQKGKTVVAQLDTRPSEAALALLDQERSRLHQELVAKQEELQITLADRKQALDLEARRLAGEVEGLKLKILDCRAAIEADKIELQRVTGAYENAKDLASRSVISQRELLEAQLRKDAVAKRLAANEAILTQVETQRENAAKQLGAIPATQTAAVDKILEPLRTRIVEHQQKVQLLMAQIESLTIVAPLTGQVSAVHRHPGETVQAGDPIISITDEESHHIVSYVREDQKIRPTKGMRVQIRSRFDGKVVPSEVEEVGPRYAPIPVHHSRAKDPKASEWGLPILIRLPPALSSLRPGELVEVSLKNPVDDEDAFIPSDLGDRN